jgi:hypothetical protein
MRIHAHHLLTVEHKAGVAGPFALEYIPLAHLPELISGATPTAVDNALKLLPGYHRALPMR